MSMSIWTNLLRFAWATPQFSRQLFATPVPLVARFVCDQPATWDSPMDGWTSVGTCFFATKTKQVFPEKIGEIYIFIY